MCALPVVGIKQTKRQKHSSFPPPPHPPFLSQPIPDVPAVYFVTATPASIDRIAADAAAGTYDKLYIHFCGGIDPPLLSRLATAIAAAPAPALTRVGGVTDQHLAFVALEAGLFSLRQRDAFARLHAPSAADADVAATIGAVVEGLYSVVVTLGVVPVIRCPKVRGREREGGCVRFSLRSPAPPHPPHHPPQGGPAQAVASALDARLRDAARASRLGAAAGGAAALGGARPLLAILDRAADLATPLAQAWTYKPLVADVLGLELNRVTLAGEGGGAGGHNTATAEVGPGDPFWEANGGKPFPAVAEEVDAQLKKYRAAVDAVNRSAAAGGGAAPALGGGGADAAALAAAVASLPELADRKKVLDRHTNIATQLLQAIKARGLDAFAAVEEDVVSGKAGVGEVEQLIATAPAGATPADKLRAALVLALAAATPLTDEEAGRLAAAVDGGGGGAGGSSDAAPALAYVRRLRRLATRPTTAATPSTMPPSSTGVASWADRALAGGAASLARAARGLLRGEKAPPLVLTVDGLAGGKPLPDGDAYVEYDPRAPAGGGRPLGGGGGAAAAPGAPPPPLPPCGDVVVAIVGGACYAERDAFARWGARAVPAKRVVYGGTELVAGEGVAATLAALGRAAGLG